MSFFTNQAIGSSGSRTAGNRGQNSLKLDKITAYFRRKLFKRSQATTSTTPRSSTKHIDKTILIKDIPSLKSMNHFNMLLDEVDELEYNIRTGFREETYNEERIVSEVDTSETDNIDDTTAELNKKSKVNFNFRNGNNNNGIDATIEVDMSDRTLVVEKNREHTKEDDTEVKKHTVTIKKQVRFTKGDDEVNPIDINNFNKKVRSEFPELYDKLAKFSNGMYDISPLRQLGISEKFEKDDAATQSISIVDNDAQNNNISLGTEALDSELIENQELFRIPSRSKVNKIIKSKKYYKAHSQLLTFLRCKTFLKHRDTSLIQQLVHLANNWMQGHKYLLDDPLHYSIISSAVTVAFMISEEELQFRQSIKNKTNWDNMKHLNATITGDLGKVFRVPGDRLLNEDNPLHKVMDDLSLKPNPLII